MYRHKTAKSLPMHRILVINPKGGCGKSTISTQLAGYYANWGMRVGLADMDRQKSSLHWLQQRPMDIEPILGINAVNGQISIPEKLDYLIVDTPAALDDFQLAELARISDTLMIPVLPSAMDTRAASRFVFQLLVKYRLTFEDRNICVIANRVKLRSVVYRELLTFLESINLPLVTTLRESKFYLECAASGKSLFDLPRNNNGYLINDWQPIINWLHQIEYKKFNKATSVQM